SPDLAQRLFADAKLPLIVLLGVLGLASGVVVAFAELNALYLAASLVGSVFILLDFRVGVVLLVLLLPVSRSYVFPHAMLGITGLNPFNLLLVGTLCSCLLHGLFGGSLRRFMPRPLLWLYIAPILVAGAMGLIHLDEIPTYLSKNLVEENPLSVAGYFRDH